MMAATAPQLGHFHHIEEEDVLRAPILAKKSQRRRIDLIPGELNIIFFSVPLDQGRTASVKLYITPLCHDLAQHTLYSVDGSYTPSHDDIHIDQVLGATQLIYDTYIDVIWLKLNGDILKHQSQEPFTPSAIPNLSPSNTSSRIVPLVPTRPTPFENGRKRLRRSDSTISSSDSEVEGEGMLYAVSEPGRSARITSNRDQERESLVAKITKMIQKGQDSEKKRDICEQEKNCDHAVFQCAIPEDNKTFYLDQVEETLERIEISLAKGGKIDKRKRWTAWFFLSCLKLAREGPWEESWQKAQRRKNRKNRNHKPFQAAKVANLIVNNLLVSDGMAAMGVYSALAECGYKLSKASELSALDIELVSKRVANDLCGQIHAPADYSIIPFPGVWLSTLFQTVQYSEIYNIIGLPKLACLRFESTCNPLIGGNLFITGVKMAVLKEKWNTASSWTNLGFFIENRAQIL